MHLGSKHARSSSRRKCGGSGARLRLSRNEQARALAQRAWRGVKALPLEGRGFFDHLDDVRSKYQFWGGVRVRVQAERRGCACRLRDDMM
jgi:hypothetical protein